MAVIVRTAGAERGKAEIKRDFEYLIRLWNDVRELTLASTAPALIHEEANIIKRALRDMYTAGRRRSLCRRGRRLPNGQGFDEAAGAKPRQTGTTL